MRGLEAGSLSDVDGGYDVFVAHSGSDSSEGRRLYDLLTGLGQCRVFLDDVSLSPGDVWDDAVPKALLSSMVVVVLVSRSWNASYYVPSEVVGALRRAQSNGDTVRIVPLFLEDCPEPYGLERLVSLSLGRDGTMADVAGRIYQLTLEMKGQNPAVSKEHSSLAGELDRLEQERKKTALLGHDVSGILEDIRDVKRKLREGGFVSPGDVLGRRYELVEQVGQGGFATVFRAWDRELCRIVAVKVLHPRAARDETKKRRFLRGARAMKALTDKGVSGVVRALQEAEEDGGYLFFPMEFLSGGDFKDGILTGRIAKEEVIKVILRVGLSLQVAHNEGLLHRDIKPENIMLDQAGEPRVGDFDLVWIADTTGGTKMGALGTFAYAAPELLAGGAVASARTDIYSLAMTAAFGLYGRTLPPEAFRQTDRFVSRLPLSEPIKRVLLAGLEWDPEKRPATMLRFCRALRDAAFPLQAGSIEEGRTAEGSGIGECTSEEKVGSARRPWAAGLGAVALAVLALGFSGFEIPLWRGEYAYGTSDEDTVLLTLWVYPKTGEMTEVLVGEAEYRTTAPVIVIRVVRGGVGVRIRREGFVDGQLFVDTSGGDVVVPIALVEESVTVERTPAEVPLDGERPDVGGRNEGTEVKGGTGVLNQPLEVAYCENPESLFPADGEGIGELAGELNEVEGKAGHYGGRRGSRARERELRRVLQEGGFLPLGTEDSSAGLMFPDEPSLVFRRDNELRRKRN